MVSNKRSVRIQFQFNFRLQSFQNRFFRGKGEIYKISATISSCNQKGMRLKNNS